MPALVEQRLATGRPAASCHQTPFAVTAAKGVWDWHGQG